MKTTMVMVLYRQKPEESKTFQTLKKILLSKEQFYNEIDFVIYDNSPEKQKFYPLGNEGIHISYIHDSRNLGIATAYNYSLSLAIQNGSQWLLLFLFCSFGEDLTYYLLYFP